MGKIKWRCIVGFLQLYFYKLHAPYHSTCTGYLYIWVKWTPNLAPFSALFAPTLDKGLIQIPCRIDNCWNMTFQDGDKVQEEETGHVMREAIGECGKLGSSASLIRIKSYADILVPSAAYFPSYFYKLSSS